MTQVEQAGDCYMIQVKENQPKLLEHCRHVGKQFPLSGAVNYDASHGFVCTRKAQLQVINIVDIDSLWEKSGLQTLVVMNRETFNKSTHTVSNETAYYLSNYQNDNKQYAIDNLAKVIRGHWVVESTNWQLDVTFGQDSVKTKNGNQALIMGKLRCFSMNLMRWGNKGIKNFQASIEKFTDSPESLISMLRQVNFL